MTNDEDDETGATRRQVLAGAAGAATLPAWATRNEHAAAAYTRQYGDDPGVNHNAIFADIDMYQEPTQDIDINVDAWVGDVDYPDGMIQLEFRLGPFKPHLTFDTDEARALARTLQQAAQDAEVMTQAELADYREGNQ